MFEYSKDQMNLRVVLILMSWFYFG